jgi:1,4-alpha-glucan branching enzyme
VSPEGFWCPVLHAHLPYVRHPEQPAFLEEDWFFEAVGETYVPLLRMLDRLAGDGVGFRLTLGLSPPLLAMMADPLLGARYRERLRMLGALADAEAARAERAASPFAPALRFQAAELAATAAFLGANGPAGLPAGFNRHARAGGVELLTTAATHGVLPLLATVPEAVRAQVRVGADASRREYGTGARGVWLPECGYAPGQENVLREAGLRYSFLEEHGVADAHPRPFLESGAPVMSPGGVAFFARDPWSSEQVWSAKAGYPGDPDYREFHRDQGYELSPSALGGLAPGGRRRAIGLKLHRVTGPVPLEEKAPWDPARARTRAEEHAGHFVSELERRAAAAGGGRPLLIVSPYDAELFGHWWFEGPWFLERVFRLLHEGRRVRAVTPLEYLAAFPECEVVQPAFSTWGAEGYAAVWLDPRNDWIYLHLDVAAEGMVALARRFEAPTPLERRALNQAARELLLAQSSDWAFIMKTGTAVEYAVRRTQEHLLRFQWLKRGLVERRLDADGVAALEERTRIFPEIAFEVYR